MRDRTPRRYVRTLLGLVIEAEKNNDPSGSCAIHVSQASFFLNITTAHICLPPSELVARMTIREFPPLPLLEHIPRSFT